MNKTGKGKPHAVAIKPECAIEQSKCEPARQKARAYADLATGPSFSAAAVAIDYLSQPGGELSINALFDSISGSIESMRTGDLGHAEAMLFGQAHALQAMFVDLARKATRMRGEGERETCMRMAFKAQNQCRMTLETLGKLRNPPVVIARQANISHGPQQVNNTDAAAG